MPNIVIIMKDTHEQVMIQPKDSNELHYLLMRHKLISYTKYLSKGTWAKMCSDYFTKIEQGIIVTSRYLRCHMYLAPESIKPMEEEVATCPSCGQELPDEN